MEHTYYIAKHKKVYGTHADNKDVIALLYAKYMLHTTGYIGQQDGASFVNGSNKHVSIDNRLRVCVSLPKICTKCQFKNDPLKFYCKVCENELPLKSSEVFDIM